MSNLEPLSERARGRWRAILPLVGVDARFLTRRNGPCPMCGGKDRWRFTDLNGSGSWFCNQCGRGGGAALVMALKGCDFPTAAKIVEPLIGAAPAVSPKPRDEAKCRADQAALWRSGAPLTPDTLASRYLSARGMTAVESLALRALPGMMIAKVSAPDGSGCQVHRTYLSEPGTKRPENPRKLMPGSLPKGAAVQLAKPGPRLGIAEGIETALSAATLFGLPAWSALFADNLAAFEPPDGTVEIAIFADHDSNHHGQWAAESLARRLHAKSLKLQVHVPPSEGTDWNDVLRQRGPHERRQR